MSGRGKIKSKVVKATLANKDVLDMFQGVLGTSEGAATLSITHPKYLRIQNHVDRFVRLMSVIRESRLMTLFPGPREHLSNYVTALKEQFAASFNAPDFAPWLAPVAGAGLEAQMTAGYSKVPPEVVAQFGETFAAAKKCNVVNTAIVTCKNLVSHKKSLGDQNALKDRFLVKGAGMTFAPIHDLPQVNFKQIYIDDRLTPSDKEFVLVALHKMYTIGHDVYEAVSAPDVDVNEFVGVIMSSIGEVKKHIPRCDQAFQKIVESVDLLKGNFGDYYKDFTASGNPTIIMENFVLDVSKNTGTSPAVTAQFRRIISHYRKLAGQQATNPKLQSLFSQVDANFQELERKSKAADAEGSDSDADSDAADAAADAEGFAGDDNNAGGDDNAAPAPPAPAGKPAGKAKHRRKKAVRAGRAKGRAKVAARPAGKPQVAADGGLADGGLAADDGLADEFDREAPSGLYSELAPVLPAGPPPGSPAAELADEPATE